MGTNAIPTLLKWMSEPDPPEAPKTNVAPCFNTTRSQRAEMAFAILGETARPAIPELTRLALTSSDPKRVERCVDCLAGIGPEAVGSLLSLATNGPPVASWHGFHALYAFERSPVAVAIAPALIKCLSDEREDVVAEAASLLAAFNLPGIVVPVLTNALQSPSALTRTWAVRCLGFHDEKAVSAIPLLRAAMRDPDYKVRESATNVLRSWGGWQLDATGRWFRVRGTNTLYGITPDFFTESPR
jgi:HEAT repeat protein